MQKAVKIGLAALALFAAAASSAAQGLFGQQTDYASIHFHSGRAMADGARKAALRMELKPGWKTYWRKPGETGIPPHFDWRGSTNLKAVSIDWPTPTVFETYGSRTIGYEERMILPVTLTPENPAEPIEVRLNFTYGLCREICIPGQEDIALSIPSDAPEDGGFFLDRAADQAPMSAVESGLVAHECKIEGAGEIRRFVAVLSVDMPLLAEPVIIAEGPEGVWFGPVTTTVDGGTLIAEGAVRTEEGRWIGRDSLSLTVLGAARAITLDGCANAG